MSSVWKKEMKNFFVHHECDCTCWLYYGKQQQNAVKYTGIVLICISHIMKPACITKIIHYV